MEIWVVFILLYGLLKGAREPIKKIVLGGLSTMSALFGYTFIGFLMSVPTVDGAFSITLPIFGMVVVKSAVIFAAWMLSFKALKKVPVSVYGLFDMSRVIFSTLLGVVFLHEVLTFKGTISLLLVIAGLYFVDRRKGATKEDYKQKYVWFIFFGCLLNAISGAMDKYIMSTGKITASALQFWFMLLLALFYFIYMLCTREKIEYKKIFTNPWIYVISFSLVFGDRLLFIANSDPNSQVVVMTVLKQCSAVVTIVLGKLMYKEKNIAWKLFCASIIILGIVISIL